MRSIVRAVKLCSVTGVVRKQHVAAALESAKYRVECRTKEVKTTCDPPLNALAKKEQTELQRFASELSSAYQSGEVNEQLVLRALEVIRPIVRPLRKERKRQNGQKDNGSASISGSRNIQSESLGVRHTAPTNSRHMATHLHPKLSVPPLGCPLPLPLEKKHNETLRTLLGPATMHGTSGTYLGTQTSTGLLSTWTRESLLRSQEALYDILLVRGTLTYWLYFARVPLKKGQRNALIDAIAGIRNVPKDQLDIAAQDRKSKKKPVIDNGLERYVLFKYQAHSTNRHRDLQQDSTPGNPIQRQPLFSWESLFGGLSAGKQVYQREAYEAKTRVISYTPSRGPGNEVSFMSEGWIEETNPYDSAITVGMGCTTEIITGERRCQHNGEVGILVGYHGAHGITGTSDRWLCR